MSADEMITSAEQYYREREAFIATGASQEEIEAWMKAAIRRMSPVMLQVALDEMQDVFFE